MKIGIIYTFFCLTHIPLFSLLEFPPCQLEELSIHPSQERHKILLCGCRIVHFIQY